MAETSVFELTNSPRTAPGENYLQQALAHRANQQWAAAIQACRQAIQSNPQLVEAYKILGDAHQKQGQYAAAIGYYGQAITIKPDYPEVYANLGSLYAEQQKWPQALEYYQKALEIKPDLAGVYENIARVKQHLPSAAPQINAAEIYLQQALAYREKSQWSEASQACEAALKLNPKLAEAYKILGDASQKLGKISQAISYYGQAITLQPNFPEAYANLGSLYAQQKQWQQALDYYHKALELKPEESQIYHNLARVWQNLGQPEKAQQMLAQAKKLAAPNLSASTAEQLFNLGEQASQQGKLEQALKYYQQAVQRAPKFSQAYQRLAAITEKLGLWQESTIYYRQLLQLKESVTAPALPSARKQLSLQSHFSPNSQPGITASKQITRAVTASNSAEYQVKLGNAAVQKQQWQAAIDHYQKAIELNPKLAAAYRNLARVYTQIGKTELATSSWLQAINLDAQGLQAGEYLQLAKNLTRQGQSSSAVTCYRRAIKLQPSLIQAYLHLGQLLTQVGEFQQAIACYRQGIQHHPQHYELYFNLGLCYSQETNWEAAINCYRKALEIKSDYWAAAHNLGGALGCQQNWTEALAVYRRAIEIKPDAVWSYNDLGLMLLQTNQAEEAVKVLRKAVSLKDDWAEGQSNLGDALTAVGQWREAIAAYQRAGELKADLTYLNRRLGHVLFRQSEQDRQHALNYFQQAIKDEPNNIQNYHQALAIDKNNLELYLGLGNVLMEQNNLDEAIVAYQMAVQLQPKNVEATIRLTHALHAKNPQTMVNSSESQ